MHSGDFGLNNTDVDFPKRSEGLGSVYWLLMEADLNASLLLYKKGVEFKRRLKLKSFHRKNQDGFLKRNYEVKKKRKIKDTYAWMNCSQLLRCIC